MLHTKFHGNQPAGSREDFTIYGHGGQFGHVTSIMSSDFYFLVPESMEGDFSKKSIHINE